MGGRNKALVEVAGRPLIDWVIDRARPQVDQLAINANSDFEAGQELGLSVFPDTLAESVDDPSRREGPLAGIVAGLAFATSKGFDSVATFAVDTPRFPIDLVARLGKVLAALQADYAVAATPDGEHPVFGLWPTVSAVKITAQFRKGVRAPRLLAMSLKQAIARFDDPEAFLNVNRPEDIPTIERLLR